MNHRCFEVLGAWKAGIFADARASWLWLFVRLFLASIWLSAGYEKVVSPQWVGPDAGAPVKGFVLGALAKTAGEHPDVLAPYAWFLEHCVAPIPALWSHLVAFGEVAVGLGLLFGVLTTTAAFFASVMNGSFLLSGTVGINPYLLALEIPLIFAWRVSSRIGLSSIIRRFFPVTRGSLGSPRM